MNKIIQKKPNPLVSMHDVSLSLSISKDKKTSILHNINLEIEQNDSISIIGASGSGKTSLLMLIAGIERPTKGSILIKNQDIAQMTENDLCNFRAKRIGIVFQNLSLIPTMSAFENVKIAMDLILDERSEEKAHRWLELVGLSHRANHYPSELSGGEQQRVVLARAFSTKPDLLLADEPTGNLDSENSNHVMDLLFALKEQFNTTFVLVTHNNDLAKKTNHQYEMKDGKILKIQ